MTRQSGTEPADADPADAHRPTGTAVGDRWPLDAVPDVSASSRVGGAVVVFLAVGLLAMHVRHLFIMDDPVGTVVQVVGALVLSVGLLWAGVSVWRGGLIPHRVSESGGMNTPVAV